MDNIMVIHSFMIGNQHHHLYHDRPYGHHYHNVQYDNLYPFPLVIDPIYVLVLMLGTNIYSIMIYSRFHPDPIRTSWSFSSASSISSLLWLIPSTTPWCLIPYSPSVSLSLWSMVDILIIDHIGERYRRLDWIDYDGKNMDEIDHEDGIDHVGKGIDDAAVTWSGGMECYRSWWQYEVWVMCAERSCVGW